MKAMSNILIKPLIDFNNQRQTYNLFELLHMFSFTKRGTNFFLQIKCQGNMKLYLVLI